MPDEDGLSQQVVAALSRVLLAAIEESERYEDDLPHLVACTDLVTGFSTYSGPFDCRAAAERVADHEHRSIGKDETLTFNVAPLYPPLKLMPPANPETGVPEPREEPRP